MCTCGNGTAAVALGCVTHHAEICASCDDGYHSSGSACAENQCTCVNGEGAVGPACDEHESATCSSCIVGYHLKEATCNQNICTCPNGAVAVGASCVIHQEVNCASCSAGYHLGGSNADSSALAASLVREDAMSCITNARPLLLIVGAAVLFFRNKSMRSGSLNP